jgi:hypothetical protein
MRTIPSTIAIVSDCDDTLAPDTTAQLLEHFGVPAREFYSERSDRLVTDGYDPPLAYHPRLFPVSDGSESGNPLQATYEIKFAQHVFFARVEPGPRIEFSITEHVEPFGHIRLGSSHSGAIWIGPDCIAEFEQNPPRVTAKVTPVIDGRRNPDAVTLVDPVTYLLREALNRQIVR